MDGHADADRLPIQKMRRYIRHIFQISASMRIAKNIRMAIPKLAISPLTSQKKYFSILLLDKPARLFIILLFGFASDSVFDKLNQSTNSETAVYLLQESFF